ncbi:unnamed protein product [Wuchereria bancrofti]|uniref:Uncharacterized protein n=1 Tax=Wuchereria bancrofti TaxID=6293 RepID=A0A3P7DPV1_WUCBA|nr:unnamed protein product [Wuchereria bancrofti]
MDEGNDGLKSRSRKQRGNGKDKCNMRKRYRDQKLEDSEGKDDVSCCGRPRRKNESHRRKHHRKRHKGHKSRRLHKSQKDVIGTKEDSPSPLRPPTPPLPQSSTLAVAMKEKQKEDKESGEMTRANQGKISTSGEVTGQGKASAFPKFPDLPSSQLGTSSSPPALPSRDSQKVEGRENPYQLTIMNKTELLQELCITQCTRDGYEISRLAYTTCFPLCKKPNFIYLPKLRFTANNNEEFAQKNSAKQNGIDLLQERAPPVKICQNHTSDLLKQISSLLKHYKNYILIYQVLTNYSYWLLEKVHKYTKVIVNNLKYLRQLIDRKFTT